MEVCCNEIVNIYLFVRNGANMANFVRQMPMRQTKFKIFAVTSWTQLDNAFFVKELKLGNCCGTMLELRLNIRESKILETLNVMSLLLTVHCSKIFKIAWYLHCKSTQSKALQLCTACLQDKYYRKQTSSQNEILVPFFNRAVSIKL